MAKDASVDYDIEEDILYVSTGVKVQDSIEFDQFIIDFSADDKIVGLEIMNASGYLEKFFESEIDMKQLEEIKIAKFSVIEQKEFSIIKIVMKVPLKKGVFEEMVFTATAPIAVVA